jgi:hypothetical protein
MLHTIINSIKWNGWLSGENHFGLNERIKSRGFQATQFNLKANSGSTNTVVDPNNLDLFYNQNNFSNGVFLLPLSVETL